MKDKSKGGKGNESRILLANGGPTYNPRLLKVKAEF